MSINLLGNTVYLSNVEYDKLLEDGTVTLASGTTITYSENDTYIVPDIIDTIPVLGSQNSVTSEGIRKELNKGIVSISSSGTTITYKKADGTPGSLETQDTTYNSFAGSAPGLVPESNVESQGKLLSGAGEWVSPSTLSVSKATNADTVNNLTVKTAVPENAVFTDSLVTQTNSETNSDYRIALSSAASNETTTGGLYKSDKFLANPSTGAFYAKGFTRIDITGETLDLNDLTLGDNNPDGKLSISHYIQRTTMGADNITNRPSVEKSAFILDVELIRYGSSGDYVTRQIYTSSADYNHEYVRFYNKAVADNKWSEWQKRTFTDTTYEAISTEDIKNLFI